MRRKHIPVWLMILVSAMPLLAKPQVPQEDDEPYMKLVLENNPTLRAARESYQISLLSAGTGNTPPNPEVEFGYLFGNPSERGNRIDFSVSQELDFPTTYIHRSRARKIRNSQAELEYLLARQEVLLLARQVMIERIYLNSQQVLLEERLSQARVIHKGFRQKVAAGEEGQLALNQSTLHLVTLESEFEQNRAMILNNKLSIKELTGGSDLEILEASLPSPTSIIRDSIVNAYQQSPELLIYKQELELKREEQGVMVGQNLPKLSAGYYSETVLDLKFKGFQVGLTLPLWENSNTIKNAKSNVIFAEADAQRFTFQLEKEVEQMLNQLDNLELRIQNLESALEIGNTLELLALSLDNGEISLTEYFYASDFHFRNQLLLLEYKRDRLLLEAALLKVYL
jgi:cobalt-zinc-cadmium efflux system outer membrane protein